MKTFCGHEIPYFQTSFQEYVHNIYIQWKRILRLIYAYTDLNLSIIHKLKVSTIYVTLLKIRTKYITFTSM